MKQNKPIKIYEDHQDFYSDLLFSGNIISPTLIKILSHPQLSFKAKGLYILISINPEVFKNPTTDKREFILNNSKEKWDAIASGINELIEKGLLLKETHRNEGPGRNYIIGTSWHILAGNIEVLNNSDFDLEGLSK